MGISTQGRSDIHAQALSCAADDRCTANLYSCSSPYHPSTLRPDSHTELLSDLHVAFRQAMPTYHEAEQEKSFFYVTKMSDTAAATPPTSSWVEDVAQTFIAEYLTGSQSMDLPQLQLMGTIPWGSTPECGDYGCQMCLCVLSSRANDYSLESFFAAWARVENLTGFWLLLEYDEVVQPHAVLAVAAICGLLPARTEDVKSYDDGKAILMHLRPFQHRIVCPSIQFCDSNTLIDSLLRLEHACWDDKMRRSREEIASRIAAFPPYLVTQLNSPKILGVLYAQRVDSIDALTARGVTVRDLGRLHRPQGRTLQWLTIQVHPREVDPGFGSVLRSVALCLAKLDNSIDSVVAISRCRNFHSVGNDRLTYSQYVDACVASHSSVMDPGLHFHFAGGARFVKIIRAYWREDSENDGCGVLLQYDLVSTATKTLGRNKIKECPPTTANVAPFPPRVDPAHLSETIVAVIEESFNLSVQSYDQTWTEIGFDSFSITQLASTLAELLEVELFPMIFFNFPCVRALVNHHRSPFTAGNASRENAPSAGGHQCSPCKPSLCPSLSSGANDESIAIIGMACRFPSDYDTPSAFWDGLMTKTNSVGEIPFSRWNVDDFYDKNTDKNSKLKSYVRHGAFLSNLEMFDASFFGILNIEATSMDPQQRLMLEVATEAFHNAGYSKDSLQSSRTGVFVGQWSAEWGAAMEASGAGNSFSLAGGIASICSNRVSYALGLKGPSITVDTACSSSLVAVDAAISNLRSGSCSLALAAGVNVLGPHLYAVLCRARMLSPDGLCKTFDESANGYVRGEGCGAVVLKRLSDAQADGDNVLAVIRGSAVNQDGRSVSLTAPNGSSQEEVIRAALREADIAPGDVDFVETHGTGTFLGDSIELGALKAVFGEKREAPLVLGALKTNIGHLESAAGIAGLIKAVLVLQHREVPPNLNLTSLNPKIDVNNFSVELPRESIDLRFRTTRRSLVAGVCAFGVGGTNAHIVLSEAPPTDIPRKKDKAPSSTTTPVNDSVLAFNRSVFPVRFDRHPMLGPHIFEAEDGKVRYFLLRIPTYLRQLFAHHRIHGRPIVPAAAFIEMALEVGVAFSRRREDEIELEDFVITEPLFLAEGNSSAEVGNTYIKASFRSDGQIDLCSGDAATGPWQLHASARINNDALGATEGVLGSNENIPSLSEMQQHMVALTETDIAQLYGRCSARGMQYLRRFRTLRAVYKGEREALAQVEVVEDDVGGFLFHPALIDGCFQVGMALVGSNDRSLKVPFSVKSVRMFSRRPRRTFWVHYTVIGTNDKTVDANLRFIADDGSVFLTMDGFQFRQVTTDYLNQHSPTRVLYQVEWVPWKSFDWSANDASATPWLFVGADSFLKLKIEKQFPASKVFELDMDSTAIVNKRDAEAFQVSMIDPVFRGIVFVAALRSDAAQVPLMASAVALLAEFADGSGRLPVVFVTVATQAVLMSANQDMKPHHAGLWGLARTARLEIANLTIRCLDIDSWKIDSLKKLEHCLRTVVDEDEEEVAVCLFSGNTGNSFISRLVAGGVTPVMAKQLHISYDEDEVESMQAYAYSQDQNPLEPGEVAVRLSAVVIHSATEVEDFRSEPTRVVGDFSGIVVGAGRDVTTFRVGDSVFGIAEDCLGTYVRTQVEWLAHKPASWSFEEAAAMPSAVLIVTQRLAELRTRMSGRSVVVEGAHSHIGLIAAEFLQRGGCHVYALSPCENHQMLRSREIEIWSTSMDVEMESRPCAIVRFFDRMDNGNVLGTTNWFQIHKEDGLINISSDMVKDVEEQVLLPGRLRGFARATLKCLGCSKGMSCLAYEMATGGWRKPLLRIFTGLSDVGKAIRHSESSETGKSVLSLAPKPTLSHLCPDQYTTPLSTPEGVTVPHTVVEGLEEVRVMAEDYIVGVLEDLAPKDVVSTQQKLYQHLFDKYRHLVGLKRSSEDVFVTPESILKRHPEMEPEVALVHNCGSKLNEALRGLCDPWELICPDGSFDLVTAVYERSVVSELCNNVIAKEISFMSETFPADRVSILEIGGGTGATTSRILPRLDPLRSRYVFTDKSNKKLQSARNRFSQYEFVEYEIFDADKDPRLQGFAAHQFDIIVAVKVLHTTSNMALTMQNVGCMLRPGGRLVIREVMELSATEALSLGLTEGWWRFDDTYRRPHCPLLSMDGWKDLLRESGFRTPIVLPIRQLEGEAVFVSSWGAEALSHSPKESFPVVRSQAMYIISGGMGGLGLLTARVLVELGATHLILLSRSDQVALGSEVDWRWLSGSCVDIKRIQCDVARDSDVAKLDEIIQESGAPLAGIFHAAGVLSDATIANQDAESMRAVYEPRVEGAWRLHDLAHRLGAILDFFVVYSSVAGLLGSMGQSNYAAANTCMEAMVHWRRSHGLTGQSIQWGAVSKIGIAARHKADKVAHSRGQGFIDHRLACDAIESVLSGPQCPQIACVPFDWTSIVETGKLPKLVSAFADSSRVQPSIESPVSSALATSSGAAVPSGFSDGEVRALVLESVRKLLGTDINVNEPLFEAGIDSLFAIEFRNSLVVKFPSVSIPIGISFDYPTIDDIVQFLKSNIEVDAVDRSGGEHPDVTNDHIAVIGMSCHFPGGQTLEQFWESLCTKMCSTIEIPFSRWNIDDFYDPNPDAEGKTYARHGAFIDGAEFFDAAFFGISDAEAKSMDPQQRLLLKVAYDAFIRAGYDKDALRDSATGVFVGQMNDDWAHMSRTSMADRSYTATGIAGSMAANRLSYVFGLKGPSVRIDTACSSSLVAVDFAVEKLRRGACTMALVAGVNLVLNPTTSIVESYSRMLSPDGVCKVFDAGANGFVRGEGCGVVILKRLSDAESSGNNILAVIRGSAINQDGRSASFTSPNGLAQQEVIRTALREADIAPCDVDYVETHGTGTALGDPIEMGALKAVLGEKRETPLVLGALKTNIGHLEGAAGIAGLIKAVLVLHYRLVPPNLHLSTLNPHLDIHNFPVEFPKHVVDLSSRKHALVAGVSSFGLGGTNAHIVLSEYRHTSVDEESSRGALQYWDLPSIDTATRARHHPLPLLWQHEQIMALTEFQHRWVSSGDGAIRLSRDLSAAYSCCLFFGSTALMSALSDMIPSANWVEDGRAVLERSDDIDRYIRSGTLLIVFAEVVYPRGDDRKFSRDEVMDNLISLLRRCSKNKCRVTFMLCTLGSAHSSSVESDDFLQEAFLFGSALRGFLRSERIAAPWLRLRLVELDASNVECDLRHFAGCISNEAALSHDHFLEVRYHERKRSVARLVKMDSLFADAKSSGVFDADSDRRVIDGHSLYMIVGGLGGLGLLAAQALVDLGARHLVLVSRSGSTRRAYAASWLKQLKSSAPQGATIDIFACDIGEPGSVKSLGAYVTERAMFTPLRGIVHAAGTLQICDINGLTTSEFRSGIAAKIEGLKHLHAIAQDSPILDLFVAFSSISSFLGLSRCSTYAAGNSFVDAFIQWRRDVCGVEGLSVQWGPIADVGVTEQVDSKSLLPGLCLLDTHTVRVVMKELFSTRVLAPHVVVARADWNSVQDDLGLLLLERNRTLLSSPSANLDLPTAQKPPAPAQGMTSVVSEATIRDVIDSCLRAVGMHESYRHDESLMDAGLESIAAMNFRNMLSQKLPHVAFQASLIFDFPSADAIVAYIKSFDSPSPAAPKDARTRTASIPMHLPRDHGFSIGKLNNIDEGNPLFVIPSMTALARMIPYPVYGILDPMHKKELERFSSLRQLAEACILEIRKIQPEGPYWLAGYSFGCTTALYITEALERDGHRVAGLYLIDARSVPPFSVPPSFNTGLAMWVLFTQIAHHVNISWEELEEIQQSPNSDASLELLMNSPHFPQDMRAFASQFATLWRTIVPLARSLERDFTLIRAPAIVFLGDRSPSVEEFPAHGESCMTLIEDALQSDEVAERRLRKLCTNLRFERVTGNHFNLLSPVLARRLCYWKETMNAADGIVRGGDNGIAMEQKNNTGMISSSASISPTTILSSLLTAKNKIPTALIFPGQGSQFVGMLADTKGLPAVKVMLDQARTLLGYDLLELCLAGPLSKLNQTEFCQPALFVAGLAALEKLKNDDPDKVEQCQAVAGFSLGEITALCAGGMLTFYDGLTLVKHRAEAMSRASRVGARDQSMVSIVGLPQDAILGLIDRALETQRAAGVKNAVCQVANELFPTGFTVSGTSDAIDLVARAAKTDNACIAASILATSGAFHCPLMQSAVEPFRAACKDKIHFGKPRCAIYSNVTALPYSWADANESVTNKNDVMVIDVLAKQIVSTVKWNDVVANMIADGVEEFIELGPGAQLKSMMRHINGDRWKVMKNVKS
uniref:Putative polyketide synthase n=1 Tax=Hematodinium sp. SG-2015 TaxID=1649283 RepID=A0A0F7EWD5_9DINO|nr:putative polyketide synthase [Hematodinium sp. SG-2015]|eukprot:GEMP01000033.1.p1 GENE.GEMP01000033.1~~GEMP01000033.1.p1  ORF type:complete len:4303 (+),score=633.06 GEMP01000033.1:81-12989(+)